MARLHSAAPGVRLLVPGGRRLASFSTLALLLGPGLAAEGLASAGPPSLPDARPTAVEVDPPATGEEEPAEALPGEGEGEGGELETEGSIAGSALVDPFEGDVALTGGADGAAQDPAESADGGKNAGKDAGKNAGKNAGTNAGDDPGMVGGRREPAINTVRGGLGLFGTTLADVGGRHSVRVGLHSEFFRRSGFIYDSALYGRDTNERVRGTVNIGYSPFAWGEIFLSIGSQVNRNLRDQPGRQDSVANFAMGDVELGIKGAHRFFRGGGIGLGGQAVLGLVSGPNRLASERVNFGIDGLATVDLRYLTSRAFPFRFTTNIGWILDNSLNVVDFGAVSDTTSREVLRYALGVNHSRVRMRYAVDFPFRLGKERGIGLDPIAELAWDVSTFEDLERFGQRGADPVGLPRSSLWSTLGLRANLISGLHIDAAINIGLRSPAFEYGPPVAPWQLLLGIGWAFDPRPVIKEVRAPEEDTPPPPPAITDGRIVGAVVDDSGAPLEAAVVRFPGLTATALLTDAQGTFTSFRFPEGPLRIVVTAANGERAEAEATVVADADTPLTITIEGGGEVPTGILDGSFVDDQGQPVAVTLQIRGEGIDEPFSATAEGLLRVELPLGEYVAIARAEGYQEARLSFTITAGEAMIPLKGTLTREAPVETPNVRGSKRSIRLLKGIRYSGDGLSEASHGILDELATFLRVHPEYAEIEIGVHTDDRGNPSKRSADRAESVRSYLLSKGVSPDRLSAKGYGDRNPVAVNMTSSGRAKNNRTVLSVKRYTGD